MKNLKEEREFGNTPLWPAEVYFPGGPAPLRRFFYLEGVPGHRRRELELTILSRRRDIVQRQHYRVSHMLGGAMVPEILQAEAALRRIGPLLEQKAHRRRATD